MQKEVTIAGFGGQGVMLIGQLLAYAGMKEDKYVAWMPTYGPEMRGGTANCTVIISPEEIGSPVIAHPSAAIVMNRPSLDKFEPRVKEGGLLIINSSLIDRKAERTDIEILEVPANDIAYKVGNLKVANMIVLGTYLSKTAVVNIDTVKEVFPEVLHKRWHHLIDLNKEAIDKGVEFVSKLEDLRRVNA